MTDAILEISEVVEGHVMRVSERPIPFETFLDLSDGTNMELVKGVMVERMAAQLEHEKLFMWLSTLLDSYVQQQELGLVLGSRTAVEIDSFGSRLPDLLFVRQDRLDIVRRKAIYGAPNLVIEIISPNGRPSDTIGLETDYRSIGVAEIWFIDQIKRRVRVLRKTPTGYEEADWTEGTLPSEAVPGFALQVEWLFAEPRPHAFTLLTALLTPPQSE